MARTAVVIIGHSHLSSIAAALSDRPGESFDPEEGAEYFVFDTIRHGAGFQFSTLDATGSYILNPYLKELIEERIPNTYSRLFISMFGGNAHNALTLLEHPQPFDFILPELPSFQGIEGAQLLPYEVVRRFIGRLSEAYILNMMTYRNAFVSPMVHIESPPPIGDNEFVLKNLEQYFLDQSDTPKIAPRVLRYKLWRAHSNLIRDAAAAIGIEFLEAPQDAVDVDGFLSPNCYGSDSTHAGKRYGLYVLRQIEARLGVRYGGWSWL